MPHISSTGMEIRLGKLPQDTARRAQRLLKGRLKSWFYQQVSLAQTPGPSRVLGRQRPRAVTQESCLAGQDNRMEARQPRCCRPETGRPELCKENGGDGLTQMQTSIYCATQAAPARSPHPCGTTGLRCWCLAFIVSSWPSAQVLLLLCQAHHL